MIQETVTEKCRCICHLEGYSVKHIVACCDNGFKKRIQFRSDNKDGDWVEDFTHENGNYQNLCTKCGNEFMGHKRRVICKVCHITFIAPQQLRRGREENDGCYADDELDE